MSLGSNDAIRYVPVGVLIDGTEFIPEDIFQAHLPVAVPPGHTMQRVYVEAVDA